MCKENKFDVVERPQHYASTSIECIDAMRETQGDEAVKNFCVCNAFKYLWRHNSKNGDEDIRKASWYLNEAVNIIGLILTWLSCRGCHYQRLKPTCSRIESLESTRWR